jgi:DNA-binding MarR family transcriptional regulator
MSKLENQLRILETLERQPETTQASLAAQLGVAVGTVNWYLKRLIKKGYVKTRQLERRNLRYFVTPAGLALKARLTKEYMEVSLRVYRELRQAAQETLAEVDRQGYRAIAIERYGEGSREALEILRLTCMEQGVTVDGAESAVPRVRVEGTGFGVSWPTRAAHATENWGEQAGRGANTSLLDPVPESAQSTSFERGPEDS